MKWSITAVNKDVIQLLQNVSKRAINLLYPPRCIICTEICYGGICSDCVGKIKYINSPYCLKCGKQLYSEEEEMCEDCKCKKHYFSSGVAAFSYTGAVRESVFRFKYNNCREYAGFYADSIYNLHKTVLERWQADAIIPVPLHRSRQKKRGYNQAELIAGELGKKLNIPVLTESLVRVKKTKPLKDLDEKNRQINLKNAFQMGLSVVECKKIVLVDDIYTTGATIDACAKVLLEAGAAEVYFVTACIGLGF